MGLASAASFATLIAAAPKKERGASQRRHRRLFESARFAEPRALEQAPRATRPCRGAPASAGEARCASSSTIRVHQPWQKMMPTPGRATRGHPRPNVAQARRGRGPLGRVRKVRLRCEVAGRFFQDRKVRARCVQHPTLPSPPQSVGRVVGVGLDGLPTCTVERLRFDSRLRLVLPPDISPGRQSVKGDSAVEGAARTWGANRFDENRASAWATLRDFLPESALGAQPMGTPINTPHTYALLYPSSRNLPPRLSATSLARARTGGDVP